MSKNLVIVESPGKTKTIENFLGTDFHVMSSQGHIRDIEGVGRNSMGIDLENGFTPNYMLDPAKARIVHALQQEAAKADTVWLASDEDREGEAIAWHLREVLALPKEKTKRIVFHEITPTAIQEAILHPRDIDYNLVNAQQARRVLDRIVGFELSPVLWRKITTGLSAGRVQSVAVRLIVEKEQEIENFISSANYRVTADFIGKDVEGKEVSLRTELNHRFPSKAEAQAYLESLRDATFTVKDIQRKPGKKSPAAPFTTSLLQQEAARKLRFSVSKTMRIAQALYESGKITYMRTDSVNLSTLAITTAKKEVLALYGENYHKTRNYKTSSKGAQEAHEAIRPTYMNNRTIQGTADEKNLYELIWKRTLASQMADAQVETTRIEVAVEGSPYAFVATGEVVLFDGFMRVYVQSNDDETDEVSNILPQLATGTPLRTAEVVATEAFSKAPLRFTEASLVKKMEDLGIGRPSTYATIIDTIQSRHYVERGNVSGKKREYNILTLKKGSISDKTKQEVVGADSGKLMPTDLGRATNAFLVEQFPHIMSYDFTAEAEKDFDHVAEGEKNWQEVVKEFYQNFHPAILGVSKGKIENRQLGIDPHTHLPVFAKISKSGPVVQLGSTDGAEKPKFASLAKGQSIFSITLEEALQLFDQALPKTLGTYKGEEVVIGEGKYGPYVRHKDSFVSIPKQVSPQHITLEEAIALVQSQQKRNEPIHVWGDVQVLNGRYGAYIKQGESNFKIPRGTNPATLTLEACLDIIAHTDTAAPKKRAFAGKK